MRLWHYKLISVLPKNQLCGQWRELNSIFKLQNRHMIINFIYEYKQMHLAYYSKLVVIEMQKRGYKYNLDNLYNYFKPSIKNLSTDINLKEDLFKDKMNYRYLTQCYYNLQEKYDCGGITQQEWNKIEELYRKEKV